ncbi:hypothetical protein LMG19282_05309 [Cupriavidus campinensis]|uniref:Lipoprotein n=1 Tax=Cupriavidus campinensis TaxID=151783 RepID=A0AAE9L1Z4_9BURK|nr:MULTISPECIES: hypothetical protein [Cupriavidus]TSP12371.1 hypothetical protein FGG12_12310 [Cupriavidus campinensis]URF03450.1 hypothetical protein M5D45_13055 [Cupriavidus campinensis]CAG2156798.1 hypothetical protein LMG19282_05309 [Cupriavidus campinensis]
MTRAALIVSMLAAAALLAACSEKPQTVSSTHKKSDSVAWQGAPGDPFVAKGWTAGDKDSWQRQIHQRNQYQNEYNRTQ